MDLNPKRIRIYSRRGDLGETSLLYGPRVGKDHRRIELLGALDELSAHLGFVRALEIDSDVNENLKLVQRFVYVAGREVASIAPTKLEIRRLSESDITTIEGLIDLWDAKAPPVRAFVLPSGRLPAVSLHVARTICRRAERRACALLRFDSSFSPRVGAWLNRVGDLLFVLARFENYRLGISDEMAFDGSDNCS